MSDTWEFPRIKFIQINNRNDFKFNRKSFNFSFEIITNQFFICWVKSEAWWKRTTSHSFTTKMKKTLKKEKEEKKKQLQIHWSKNELICSFNSLVKYWNCIYWKYGRSKNRSFYPQWFFGQKQSEISTGFCWWTC